MHPSKSSIGIGFLLSILPSSAGAAKPQPITQVGCVKSKDELKTQIQHYIDHSVVNCPSGHKAKQTGDWTCRRTKLKGCRSRSSFKCTTQFVCVDPAHSPAQQYLEVAPIPSVRAGIAPVLKTLTQINVAATIRAEGLSFASPYGSLIDRKKSGAGVLMIFAQKKTAYLSKGTSLEAMLELNTVDSGFLRNALDAKTDAEAFRRFIQVTPQALEKRKGAILTEAQVKALLHIKEIMLPKDAGAILDIRRVKSAVPSPQDMEIFQVGIPGKSDSVTALIFRNAIYGLQFPGLEVTQSDLDRVYASLVEH